MTASRLVGSVLLCSLLACARREPPAPSMDAPRDLGPAAPDTALAVESPDAAPDSGPAKAQETKKKKPAAERAEAPRDDGASGPAVASIGKIAVTGDLPKAEVDRLLKSRVGAFRACYERELEKHPALKGRLLLELTVAARGSVALADVKSSTLGGGEAEMCVGQLARDLRFKARPGTQEAQVTFPIEFRRRR